MVDPGIIYIKSNMSKEDEFTSTFYTEYDIV